MEADEVWMRWEGDKVMGPGREVVEEHGLVVVGGGSEPVVGVDGREKVGLVAMIEKLMYIRRLLSCSIVTYCNFSSNNNNDDNDDDEGLETCFITVARESKKVRV
ncbi:hypothetical protein AAHE18_08G065200 [Arachis hypogaea]